MKQYLNSQSHINEFVKNFENVDEVFDYYFFSINASMSTISDEI